MPKLKTTQELMRRHQEVLADERPVDPSGREVVPGIRIGVSPEYGVVVLNVNLPMGPNGAVLALTEDDARRLQTQLTAALATTASSAN